MTSPVLRRRGRPHSTAVAATPPTPPVDPGFAGPGTVGHTYNGHTLSTFAGNKTLTANEVLADKTVTGYLQMASGAQVSDCNVGKYLLALSDLASVGYVDWSTLGPSSGQESTVTFPDLRRAVSFGKTVIRRCDIRGMVDGVFGGESLTIEDSWVHGNYKMASDPDQGGTASHCDSVAITKGSGALTRCRLDMFPWQSGQLFDKWDDGTWPLPSSAYAQVGQATGTQLLIVGRTTSTASRINGWTIDGCRMAGYLAGNMILHTEVSGGVLPPINVVYQNNVIDVRGIAAARKVLAINAGIADPTWTNNTLATDYTASSGNFYAAGSTITLAKAKTNMSGW